MRRTLRAGFARSGLISPKSRRRSVVFPPVGATRLRAFRGDRKAEVRNNVRPEIHSSRLRVRPGVWFGVLSRKSRCRVEVLVARSGCQFRNHLVARSIRALDFVVRAWTTT